MSSLVLAFVLLAAAPAAAPKDSDCLECHEKGTGPAPGSAHEGLSCSDCHTVKMQEHPDTAPPPVDCAACHEDAVRDLKASVHGGPDGASGKARATCRSCHGAAHEIRPKSDPASKVAKKNLPETCGACHANPEFLAQHHVPFARPVETYRLSVHGRAVEAGNEKAATCSDCHGSHTIRPGRDPKSPINHWNVVHTCAQCHADVAKTYVGSVHGKAVAESVPGAPVCTDCHGEHAILAPSEPGSLVNPARVSSVTCGRCHSDERLAARYNLPVDKVAAFQDSFHGLALRSGSQTVANCASCHGVHDILPASDPRSTVNPANLARTCGQCHPGAGTRFALGPIHIREGAATEHPVVRLIRIFYLWIIPLTLGFMAAHNALDFVAKLVRGTGHGGSHEQVPRMNRHFRIAHALTVLSFPILVVTGFALKYPESWWAHPLVAWEGQAAIRGTVHRIAALVLILSLLYHLVHLWRSPRDRAILRHMLPKLRDVQDLLGVLRYNAGLTKERPTFGKFSYAEKMEYLAFLWGTVVMALTGFVLWFNNLSLTFLPKWVSDAATVTHFYEAILASLAILIWHFYMVIFDPSVYPMDMSWLTGKVPADHLRETRPAYYRALLSEQAEEKASASEETGNVAKPESDRGSEES